MKDHAHDWAYPFGTRWEKTRALFDPTILIPRHALEATDSLGNVAKRVFVSRAWIPNYDNGAAGWTKEYAKAGYDLRAFNTAERNMLESLGKVPNCYKLVDNYSHASKLSAPEKNAYITMTHMGPTVYDWQHWPVRVGVQRKRFTNLFELPGNFVRLALAGLNSLSQIHDRGFVHMDYRMPNVCLATRGVPLLCLEKGDVYLKIQLDWSNLKAIDFGFSIARGKTPHTLLPLLEGATPAAKALITRVEELGRQRFAAFSPAERNEFKATQFSDVQHDHNFWTTRCEDALDQLRAIDWREDCYQFGRQLQYIRDHAGLKDFLDENPYLKSVGGVTSTIRELPEHLIALGQDVAAYPARGSTEATELEQARKDTYHRLIRGLEMAIRDMPADWSSDEVLIFQSDIVKPDAGSAHQKTAVRPPVRRFPWKKAAAVVVGSAALLAALPNLQAWTKTTRPAEPIDAPQPSATPTPTPEELAAHRAAEEATQAAQARATALAAWREQAASIEQTAWWQRNAGKPTPAQLAWVRETQRLASEYAELDPLIDLAALHCSGRAAPLIARSSTECGHQLTAVLQHADFAPDRQEGLLKQIVAILDARVYNHPPGQADTAFSTAILPGLQALGSQVAPFAFHGSYIQGCVQQPVQLAAAGKQLETLLQIWPNSPAAREARRLEWPERLQRGDNLCVNP